MGLAIIEFLSENARRDERHFFLRELFGSSVVAALPVNSSKLTPST
jgi:hypothetical protein